MEKAVTCKREHCEGDKTSFSTSAKLKRAPFRATATNSLSRETRYVLRYFRRSYLKIKVKRNQWRIQRGDHGHAPPLEAHVPTLPLQKSVESKAGKTQF